MSDRPTGLTGPEPGAELERLRRLPSWLFSKLALRGARLVAELMGSTSLRSDFALLAGLEAFGPLSQAELGRRLGMDRSDVVAVLNQLEHDHYVRRRPDATDRRRNTIHLTPRGSQRLDDLERQFDEVQAALLDVLSPAERDQLIQLLHRLLDRDQQQPGRPASACSTPRPGQRPLG